MVCVDHTQFSEAAAPTVESEMNSRVQIVIVCKTPTQPQCYRSDYVSLSDWPSWFAANLRTPAT